MALSSRKRRALCRTRTDDPFLTMEGRRRYGRSATLTNGHEIPANRHKSECTVVVAETRPVWIWWTENGRKLRSTRDSNYNAAAGRGWGGGRGRLGPVRCRRAQRR